MVRGSAAFVASLVAKTGDMKIVTPTATLGIRGTTGLIEVPSGGTGDVSVKLYPDANGRVGQIELFGAGGARLGTLTRASSGFSIRSGPGGFAVVPLRISAQEAARDRAFVQQTFAAQRTGRQLINQRRNQQQPGLQRPPIRSAPRTRQAGRGNSPGGRVNKTSNRGGKAKPIDPDSRQQPGQPNRPGQQNTQARPNQSGRAESTGRTKSTTRPAEHAARPECAGPAKSAGSARAARSSRPAPRRTAAATGATQGRGPEGGTAEAE